MDKHVLCVGFSCLDIVIHGADLAAFEKSKNEFNFAQGIDVSVGGDAANEAVILSRLNNQVKLMSDINHDLHGEVVRAILAKSNVNLVNCSGLCQKSLPTVANVIFVDREGERKFLMAPVDLSKMEEWEIDDSVLKGVKVLSLASLGAPPFMFDRGAALAAHLAKTAKERGIIVCADVICLPWMPTPAKYPEMYENIDYFFPNEQEAKMLTGKATISEAAEAFLKAGVKTVVIKNGKQGCLAKTAEITMEVPVFPDIIATDTTGAGDNFASGFITGLVEEQNLEQCCKIAHATAGLSVTAQGATKGVQNRQQVQELITKHEKEGQHVSKP